jgi:hypothetical protein
MLSTDRLKAVEHAMRFDEVMDLVKFHYAGSLRAVYAEVKDARDAAIERLLRAYAMVEVLDIQDRRWRRGRSDRRMPVERRTELALYYEIREFAPELVGTTPADELYGRAQHEPWPYGWDNIFGELRREHEEYTQFKNAESRSLQLYHARVLLKACKTAGTKAQIRAALVVAMHRIKEVSPKLEIDGLRGQWYDGSPWWPKYVVYQAYQFDMLDRLYREPSLLESIQGESPKVRHLDAYRLAEFVQRLFNKCCGTPTPNSSYPDMYSDAELTKLAWRTVTTIKSFAPELVAVGEGVHPRPLDPWSIIQRLIEDTAWAK